MHEPGCVHCPPPPLFFFFFTKLISKHKTRCTIKMSRTLVCCSKRLTSVSGVGSFRVPTALLLLHMWRQRGLCCLPSLLCQSKQTCLSETVTGHLLHACAHVKLHDVTSLHPCPVTVFFFLIYIRGAYKRQTSYYCVTTIGEFLSKQEAHTGPKRPGPLESPPWGKTCPNSAKQPPRPGAT